MGLGNSKKKIRSIPQKVDIPLTKEKEEKTTKVYQPAFPSPESNGTPYIFLCLGFIFF